MTESDTGDIIKFQCIAFIALKKQQINIEMIGHLSLLATAPPWTVGGC